MVRNASTVFAQAHPVAPCAGADTRILIEGGIWSDQRNEGRGRGGAFDQEGSMPGSHGTFLLHNVSAITVRNVRFRDCSAFAIQLGNASDFIIEHITFDETADGIHIEDLTVKDVSMPDPARPGLYRSCASLPVLIHEHHLTLNPDFPRTMPRGGTGHGHVVGQNEALKPR